MNRFVWLLGMVSMVAAPGTSRALGLDLAAPMICAIVDVYDCSGTECIEVESEAVGVPDIVRLDPTAKTLTALDLEFSDAAETLDSVRMEEDRVVARALHGDRNLILTVNAASGDALLTVTDYQITLVGYGACVKDKK
jgi:hypothetical protein